MDRRASPCQTPVEGNLQPQRTTYSRPRPCPPRPATPAGHRPGRRQQRTVTNGEALRTIEKKWEVAILPKLPATAILPESLATAILPESPTAARPGRKRRPSGGLALGRSRRALHACRKRFFPNLKRSFDELPDHRSRKHLTDTVRELFWMELLLLLSGIGSRAGLVVLSAAPGFYRSLKRLSGLPEMTFSRTAPHPDTPDQFLQRLPPAELEALLSSLIKPLLRQHLWDDARFDGEWLVAVDATWLRSFDHPHCSQCLTQHHSSGPVTSAHAVWEAKLLIGPTLALPLASVPIANDNRDATKQDCELTAWPRLAKLLKQRHPRLPICLTMDSLDAVGPVIDLCAQYGWSCVAVMKEGRAPAFYPQALAAAHRHPGTTVDLPAGGRQELTWAGNQDYNGRAVHFVHCVETRPDLKTPSVWGWITDRRPDVTMAPLLGNHVGRPRWTIAETFHQLKHGARQQQHDFGSQGHAWYHTWLLAQLACLLLQLLASSDLLRLASDGAVTRLRQGYQTLRNFALALLLAAITEADAILDPPAAGRVHFFVSDF